MIHFHRTTAAATPSMLLLIGIAITPLLSNCYAIGDGINPPVEFDCGMHDLAVEFAFHLQPFRSKSTFQEMVDALNMKGGAPGGETQCFNATVPDNAPDEFLPKFDPPKEGQSYFVDATNGNDADNKGTIGSPFQTVLRALDAVRENKNKRKNHASGIRYAIVFRAGVHYFNETVELESDDSHISFQNHDGEVVWLSGAKVVGENKTWTSYANKNNRPIWALDLSDRDDIDDITGLRMNRNRAVRARYPNGCTSTEPLPSGYVCMGFPSNNTVVSPYDGFGSNQLTQWVKVPPVPMKQENWTQFEPKDAPRRQSGKWFNQYQIGIGGTCQGQYIPPAGYWCGSSCAGGAPPPPGCIVSFARGMLVDHSILPYYPYENLERAVVHVWRPGHWASW